MPPVPAATDANAHVPIPQAEELTVSTDVNAFDKHIVFRRELTAKSFEASFLSSLLHVIITLTKQLGAAEV